MSNISNPTSFVVSPGVLPEPGSDGEKPAAKKMPDIGFVIDSELPQANWNISGVFRYDNVLKVFMDFVRTISNARIETLSGSLPCAWTIEWFAMRNLIPPATVVERLKMMLNRKENFVLQLDNPVIEENALGDMIGNSFLKLCSELPTMRVSVASEQLAEHIRKTFPQAQIYAGLNKVIAENGAGSIDYYCMAAERFYRIAIHPADACNLDFLEQLSAKIPPEKFEITVNDTCLRECPCRREHVELLAKIRKSPWDAMLLASRHQLLEKAECETVSASPDEQPRKKAGILTRNELIGAYALGFRNFRIQAETLRSELAFFGELCHWIFANTPEVWHKKALIAASLSGAVKDDVPILKSGIGVFNMQKYD